jgi:uridine kinase
VTSVLLTLTGGAGAGKTTIADAFAGAVVLHGDDYYVTERDRGVWIPDRTGTPRLDVGDPRSIDSGRLTADAEAALRTHGLVIVEGLFAAGIGPAVPHRRCDVFVDLAADLRLARKIHRKCVLGGFPLEVLLTNYLDHRRAAHDRHVEPVRSACDLVVDGARPADEVVVEIRALFECAAPAPTL